MRKKTYPRMVRCSLTGIVAVVRNEKEARNFYGEGVIGLAIGVVFGIGLLLVAIFWELP